jgi:hypothetical protein
LIEPNLRCGSQVFVEHKLRIPVEREHVRKDVEFVARMFALESTAAYPTRTGYNISESVRKVLGGDDRGLIDIVRLSNP